MLQGGHKGGGRGHRGDKGDRGGHWFFIIRVLEGFLLLNFKCFFWEKF